MDLAITAIQIATVVDVRLRDTGAVIDRLTARQRARYNFDMGILAGHRFTQRQDRR